MSTVVLDETCKILIFFKIFRSEKKFSMLTESRSRNTSWTWNHVPLIIFQTIFCKSWICIWFFLDFFLDLFIILGGWRLPGRLQPAKPADPASSKPGRPPSVPGRGRARSVSLQLILCAAAPPSILDQGYWRARNMLVCWVYIFYLAVEAGNREAVANV